MEARAIAGISLWTQMARSAYSSGLQAARACIFERTGRAVKTHAGTRAKFAALTRDDAGFAPDIHGFGKTYPLKNPVDYKTGPKRHVWAETAAIALDTATRFVTCVEAVLNDTPAS